MEAATKESLEERMASLFEQAQKTLSAHSGVQARLEKLVQRDANAFMAAFFKLIRPILVEWERKPATERLVQLVVRVTVCPTVLPLARKILLHLLDRSDLTERAVRLRCCQIIAGVLTALPEDYEIEENLWARLQEALLKRIHDKMPAVRVEAVHALARLQNPSDPEDEVMARLVERLRNDPHAEVRRAVLAHLALARDTLQALLERAQDVDVGVRKRLYEVMSSKVELRTLRIKHRRTLLLAGLVDRDAGVRATALQLARAWLRACQGQVTTLLKALDVASDSKAGEELVRTLLHEGPLHPPLEELSLERRVMMLQEASETRPSGLTTELALWWRLSADHLSRTAAFDQLEALLPDLPLLVRFLECHRTDEPTLVQLLELARLVDKSDEAGRALLGTAVRRLLPNTQGHATLVPLLMALLREIYTSPEELNEVVLQEVLPAAAELLDEAEEPERKALLQQQDAYLDDLDVRIAALETQLAATKGGKRAALEQELSALRKDSEEIVARETARINVLSEAWLRVLHVAEEHLRHTTLTLHEPSLAAVKDAYLKRALKWEYAPAGVRRLAMRALGIYCMLDADMARAHVPLFRHALTHDEELVQEAVLEVLFDFINLFGADLLPTEERAELMQQLYECLNHTDLALRRLAAEGHCKLLFTGKLNERRVLGTLILVFFSPDTGAEDPRLQQQLSTFLKAFAYRSGDHQRLLATVLPQVVRAVADAPPESPLQRVNLPQLLKILLELANPIRLEELLQGAPSHLARPVVHRELHNELGVKLLNDVLLRPHAKTTRHYVRALSWLHLNGTHEASLRSLYSLALEVAQLGDKAVDPIKAFLETVTPLVKALPQPQATTPATPRGRSNKSTAPVLSPSPSRPDTEREDGALAAEMLRTVDRKRVVARREGEEAPPRLNLGPAEEEEDEKEDGDKEEPKATPDTEVHDEPEKRKRKAVAAPSSGTITVEAENLEPVGKKPRGGKR